MDKLKPCPFCAGGVLRVFEDYMIQCETCKTLFVQPQTREPKSMIEMWNRRVSDA